MLIYYLVDLEYLKEERASFFLNIRALHQFNLVQDSKIQLNWVSYSHGFKG